MSGKEGDSVTKQVKQIDRVIIRFAGDSGDGMQLTGDRFTQETAAYGNDLSTLPNFPAEIRAPQGTLPGVSSFQVPCVPCARGRLARGLSRARGTHRSPWERRVVGGPVELT